MLSAYKRCPLAKVQLYKFGSSPILKFHFFVRSIDNFYSFYYQVTK